MILLLQDDQVTQIFKEVLGKDVGSLPNTPLSGQLGGGGYL